jgi:hypothetical protein
VPLDGCIQSLAARSIALCTLASTGVPSTSTSTSTSTGTATGTSEREVVPPGSSAQVKRSKSCES